MCRSLSHRHQQSHKTTREHSPLQQPPDAVDQGIESRLTQLQQLMKELSQLRPAIKTHFTKGGEQIADAICHLAAVFDQSNSQSNDEGKTQPSVNPVGSYPHFPSPLEPSLPARKTVGTELPELPRISDLTLERAVFTHQGVARPALAVTEEISYDRLEVLGDAYIEVIATRLIWHHFEYLPPGRISQLRELLVKNETLAEYSTWYEFDRRLAVPSDHRDQPKRWIKTKGDVFEAYVAAVILSNPIDGFQRVEAWLGELWLPKLKEAQPNTRTSHNKQDLAKKIMAKGIKIEYIEERPSVPLSGGLSNFYVGVYLTGWGWVKKHLGSGEGHSKADAGNDAALQALKNNEMIEEIGQIRKSYLEKNK
ncbi:hypothetical protein FQN54_005801 [Arachnomyces sp. PD_36]|nr:hypothetical protein FQN54_005801 [Arachnomyces sp. PD_36]